MHHNPGNHCTFFRSAVSYCPSVYGTTGIENSGYLRRLYIGQSVPARVARRFSNHAFAPAFECASNTSRHHATHDARRRSPCRAISTYDSRELPGLHHASAAYQIVSLVSQDVMVATPGSTFLQQTENLAMRAQIRFVQFQPEAGTQFAQAETAIGLLLGGALQGAMT